MNGLQNTVLSLIAVMLTLVLLEEAISAVAVIARTAGTTAVLRTESTACLSGVHFICSLESEVSRQKSEVRVQMSEVRRVKIIIQ